MRRRAFMAAIGGAATFPWAVPGQAALPLVGFLGLASAARWHPLVVAFREGLGSVGYVDGTNVAIQFRWAEFRPARLPDLAVELVALDAAVIVATGGAASVRAALAATKTIPIVFTLGSDPVDHGLVANLGRPGGNITGVTMIAHHLLPKKLELLSALVPKAARIGILANPASPSWKLYQRDLDAGARALGRPIEILEGRSEPELDRLFAVITERRIAGLLVVADPIFDRNARLISLAARHSIPTMYTWRDDVEAGGLISYGSSIKDAYRQTGVYTARILKGEKPSELPILQPTKVELVINTRTARALGLTIPDALLARADEVIE
jgi:putative tryptophan/tyrosine transport system substrate-binding protein